MISVTYYNQLPAEYHADFKSVPKPIENTQWRHGIIDSTILHLPFSMKLINIFGFPHFPQIADKEGNTRLISESTPDLSGRNIDENYNAEALSTTSGSSIEPRSDSSLTDNELVLNVGSNHF